jgi:hypothetical protein
VAIGSRRKRDDQSILLRFEMGTFSKPRSSMHAYCATRTTAFPEFSVEEVDAVAFSELEQTDEQVALIESFKQPFLMQERRRPVVDGEMDAYG